MMTNWKEFDEQDFCYTDSLDGTRKLHTNRDVTNEVKQFIDSNFLSKEEVIKLVEGIMNDDSIKGLEESLQRIFGEKECKICGFNPNKLKSYLIKELKKL